VALDDQPAALQRSIYGGRYAVPNCKAADNCGKRSDHDRPRVYAHERKLVAHLLANVVAPEGMKEAVIHLALFAKQSGPCVFPSLDETRQRDAQCLSECFGSKDAWLVPPSFKASDMRLLLPASLAKLALRQACR